MKIRNRFYLLIILGMIYNLILMTTDSKGEQRIDQKAKIEQELNSNILTTNQ